MFIISVLVLMPSVFFIVICMIDIIYVSIVFVLLSLLLFIVICIIFPLECTFFAQLFISKDVCLCLRSEFVRIIILFKNDQIRLGVAPPNGRSDKLSFASGKKKKRRKKDINKDQNKTKLEQELVFSAID